MPAPNEHPNLQQLPAWAVDQATDELFDWDAQGGEGPTIAERAREIARDAEERDDERHDEYDDPDQGGEA